MLQKLSEGGPIERAEFRMLRKAIRELYLTKDVIAQRSETLRQLALVKGEHVLDVGSGPAFCAKVLLRLLVPRSGCWH